VSIHNKPVYSTTSKTRCICVVCDGRGADNISYVDFSGEHQERYHICGVCNGDGVLIARTTIEYFPNDNVVNTTKQRTTEALAKL
jgi:hypothetical protein